MKRHPYSERGAGWFHLLLAGLGVAHVVVGFVMVYMHGIASGRHFSEPEEEP